MVILASLCLASVVSADAGPWLKYDYSPTVDPLHWVPKAGVGYAVLNPGAQQAATVVGYGLKGVYSDMGNANAYPNPDARNAGVIVWGTPANVPVALDSWYTNVPAYVTQWYKTPGQPPDMQPWEDFCAKYGVKY